MVVGAVLKNIVYDISKVIHKALGTLVRYEEDINRYRDVLTGRFISQETYNRTAASLKYWNSVRAIVRNQEYMTFPEARSVYKTFREEQEYMSEEEITQWHEDYFGSP